MRDSVSVMCYVLDVPGGHHRLALGAGFGPVRTIRGSGSPPESLKLVDGQRRTMEQRSEESAGGCSGGR